MQNFILWILILVFTLPSLGQVSSPLGRYQVDFVKGCAPLTVTVTDILGGPTAQYLYDADTCVMSSPKYNPAQCPPTNTTTSNTYTYTQPGTYSLVQVVASQIPRGDTVVIEVLPPQLPEYNLVLCNNLGVAVNVTDTHYDDFMIDYGDGSPPSTNRFHSYAMAGSYPVTVSGFFNNGPPNCGDSTVVVTPVTNLPAAAFSQVAVTNQAVSNGSVDFEFVLNPNVLYELQGTANQTQGFPVVSQISGSNYTLSGIAVNTQDSIYCFRIAAIDPCGGSSVYSDTLCTTTIQVTAQEGQNQLDWNTIPHNFTQYELTKNGLPLGAPIPSSNIMGYQDNDVVCDVDYCYTVTTVSNGGGRSVSVERCVTGINSLPPPKITTLTASIDGGTITLDWDPVAGTESYRIFRSVNGQAFEQLAEGTTLPFTDVNLRPQINRYCYYVIYQNSCGRESEPSVTACPVKLNGINQQNRYISLNWSPYSGWETGIQDYLLEIMDDQGVLVGPPISLGRTAMNYQDPVDPGRQISQYRIIAISNDSIPLRSFSNIIEIDIPLQVFVPNSFTPNNDGLNDTFNAKGLFIDVYSMEIYSRWGELLFHTTDLEEGWDGVYRGSLSPEDTYVFRINASDLSGRSQVITGTVHLLRKDN